MKFIKRILLIVLFSGISWTFYWAMRPLEAPNWTGFAPYDDKLLSPKPKTLWDWFQLLIIPSAIALGVWSLNDAEKKKDREIEEDRQSQSVLESYYDYMTKLILERNLRCSNSSIEVRCLARTRTLSIFRRLDGGRKAQALQFLFEAGLIKKGPIVSLLGANLRKANLSHAMLNGAEIRGAYFCEANLRSANLRKADLRGCDFSGADMRGCDLTEADLVVAKFSGSKMSNVITTGANKKWTGLS